MARVEVRRRRLRRVNGKIGVRERVSVPRRIVAPAEPRAQVAKAELEAEMIELDVLDGLAAELETPVAPGGPAERAAAAMDVVVHGYHSGSLGDDARRAVEVVAAAAARHSEVC